jgi:hypothetical protein
MKHPRETETHPDSKEKRSFVEVAGFEPAFLSSLLGLLRA